MVNSKLKNGNCIDNLLFIKAYDVVIKIVAFSKITFLLRNHAIQNKFADIVEKIEQTKTTYQKGLTELENLYDSLSHKVFNNELNFKKFI